MVSANIEKISVNAYKFFELFNLTKNNKKQFDVTSITFCEFCNKEPEILVLEYYMKDFQLFIDYHFVCRKCYRENYKSKDL